MEISCDQIQTNTLCASSSNLADMLTMVNPIDFGGHSSWWRSRGESLTNVGCAGMLRFALLYFFSIWKCPSGRYLYFFSDFSFLFSNMLCIDPTRGIPVRVDFFLILKFLGWLIFDFGPILFFGGSSLVPVPLFFSVESENADQIALTCFVLTLRAVYGYAWNFFFWNMEMSGRALSLFLFRFFFGSVTPRYFSFA